MMRAGWTVTKISKTLKMNRKTIYKLMKMQWHELMSPAEYAEKNPGWHKEAQQIPDGMSWPEWDEFATAQREKAAQRREEKRERERLQLTI
jgi:hypothetical protein